MKVAVIANASQKDEWLSYPGNHDMVVWLNEVSQTNPGEKFDACIDLLYEENLHAAGKHEEAGFPVTIINSVIHPLPKDSKFVRINGWNSFLKRNVVELAAASTVNRNRVAEIFKALNREVTWVPDIPGMISPRVVASIINEAFFALGEDISTKEEIDTAMKLGTNYPYGPFEWCERIGIKKILLLLQTLATTEERYLPAPLLIKQAS